MIDLIGEQVKVIINKAVTDDRTRVSILSSTWAVAKVYDLLHQN